MNLSLRDRVAVSFIVANLVIVILSYTVFYFLDSLNKEIEEITMSSNRIALLTDEIRISTVSILKYQRKILTEKSSPETVRKIIDVCESFTSQLQTLDTLYKDPKMKGIISTMLTYIDSLMLILNKSSLFHRDNVGMASIEELADKILEAFTDFQDAHYTQSAERDKRIKGIIKETKKNMMISIIIGFLGTIILGLIIPGKIALPFKKINDAIRELQDCNFDVSIYYNQDDEIGEIAREMNKMITSIKRFEELRQDRVSVELRKFDALANMVKKPVLVANAEGKLIYMNNQLYSLLQVQSDDVLNKNMAETRIPHGIIETFELAIRRRSKIENAEVAIPHKKDQDGTEHHDGIHTTHEEHFLYKGFANVIPIRGKESSLDYYLMVLSTEVFA